MPPKLFAVVRKDLSKSQQAVQAGHAALQYLLDYPNTHWDNGTLVLLKADYDSFEYWRDQLGDHSVFHEPDIGNVMTAFATVRNDTLFRGLSLL